MSIESRANILESAVQALNACRFAEAIEIASTLGSEPSALFVIASANEQQGAFAKAISVYRQMLETANVMKLPEKQAQALNGLAWTHKETGAVHEALDCGQQALALAKECDNPIILSDVYNTLGSIYSRSGNYKQALEAYGEALTLNKALNNDSAIGNVTSNIGIIQLNTGDQASALTSFSQALSIFEQSNNKGGIANALTNMGVAHAHMGDYPAALEAFHRVLAMDQAAGNNSNAARMLVNIGAIYRITGNYPEALEALLRSRDIQDASGDRVGLASTYLNLGSLHSHAGNQRAALESLQQALEIYQALEDKTGVARTVANMAYAWVELAAYDKALDLLTQAAERLAATGDAADLAQTNSQMIRCLIALNRFDEASQLLENPVLDKGQVPGAVVTNLISRARLSENEGTPADTIIHLEQALAVTAEHGLKSREIEIHKLLRDVYRQLNDFDSYVKHNELFVAIGEDLRGAETQRTMAMHEAHQRIEAGLREAEKHRSLLYSTLPRQIADRMLRGEEVLGDQFQNASVLFLDIVGFTSLSDRMSARELVRFLDSIFSHCDTACASHDLTKIKTIGDAYMAVAGVPEESSDHFLNAANAAIEMMNTIGSFPYTSLSPEISDIISVRIGLHCGPLVAGVIGTERLQYDVWGDTVNVASRMESTSEPGRIQVSEAFASMLEAGPFQTVLRGPIDIKGKGTMNTYWLQAVTTS